MSDPSSLASKGEQTRQALLDAAIVRFGNDGYRASSVAEITRDAGMIGSIAYAYFENKESLFLAALDEDAAGLIVDGVVYPGAVEDRSPHWRAELFRNLVAAIDKHPLTRRVLAGLEPQVTSRIVELPALIDLRLLIAGRMKEQQDAGHLRADIDVVQIGNGTVDIMVSLLFSSVQLGSAHIDERLPELMAVLDAAVAPPS